MEEANLIKLQKIRLRRIIYATFTYLFVMLVAYLIHWSGVDYVSPDTWIVLILIAAIGTILFLTLLFTNLNLKLPDPSMTRLQIIYSALWGITGVLALPNSRPLILMLYLPSFMFGSLKLNRREYLELTAIISAILACGITIEYFYLRPNMNTAYELVLWLCFTLLLVWLAFLGSYISSTKIQLRESLIRLETTELALRKASVDLKRSANTDYLTGTLNRRAFYQEIEQTQSEKSIVIMLDIDHFKKVNDNYGHDIGDLVLVESVKRIKAHLRPEDLLSRWGGEEFLILFKHTELDAALNVAERIRRTFAQKPIVVNEIEIPLSISQGIAEVATTIELPSAIRLADERLYQAKRMGRDRVVWTS